MNKFIWENMSLVERTQALARPCELSDPSKIELVKNILLEVKLKGDDAVKSFTSMLQRKNILNAHDCDDKIDKSKIDIEFIKI